MEKPFFFSQVSFLLSSLDGSNSSYVDIERYSWHHHVNHRSILFIFTKACRVILLRSSYFYESLSAGGRALHAISDIHSMMAHCSCFPKDWKDNQHCRIFHKNQGKTCFSCLEKSKQKLFTAWTWTSNCLFCSHESSARCPNLTWIW